MRSGAPERRESFFVAGGTLSAEAGSYVEREADSRLFASLTDGKFCYVLNSRQMGKSSLCVRTMKRLEAAGVRTAFVDLQRFGTNLDAERWYAGVLSAVAEGLLLSAKLDLSQAIFEYWRAGQAFGPVQRWTGVLQHVVLPALGEQRLVVFIDEIDFVRSLPFDTDEFFAAIREWYNRRARDPEFNRLSFCLLGVAIPTDLISSPTATPFNIGERIYLKDFTLEEAIPLADGFANQPHHQPLLQRVFHWTNGHPYLTQSLCVAIAADAGIRTPADVDALVERDLFEPKARETNINLADVANRALHAGDLEENPEKFRADLLSAYEKAWKGKPLADDESNRVPALLKLSGIMRSEGNQLRVRNRIYETVFDKGWVRENMPGQELRRQRRAFYLGVLRTTIIAAIVIGAIGVLSWNNSRLAHAADLARIRADKEASTAKYEAYVADVTSMKTAYDGNDLRLLDRLIKATADNPNRNIEWDYWNALLHDTPREIDYPAWNGGLGFSSDGGSLGVQDLEGESAEIYSAATMRLVKTIPHVLRSDVLFFAGGRWIIVDASNNRLFHVREALTSRHLFDLTVPNGTIESWTASNLGDSFVALWTRNGDPYAEDATVWDARTGRELHTLHSLDGRINNIGVSDDGATVAYLAVVGGPASLMKNYYGGRTAIARDLKSGRLLDRFPIGGTESAFGVSSDGRLLSYGLSGGRMILRDLLMRKTVADTPMPTILNSPAFSKDGRRMLVTTSNLAAFLIELPSMKVVERERGAINSALSPDGQLVAISGHGTRLYSSTGTNRASMPISNSWSTLKGVNSAGNLVVLTGHAVHQLDPNTLKETSKPTFSERSAPSISQDANWYLKRTGTDGADVASTSGGARLCHVSISNDAPDGFDVTPDHSKVAILDGAGRFVYVFEADQENWSWRQEFAAAPGNTCRWSPSGDRLAVGLNDGDICILDSRTHAIVKALRGPRQSINQVAFSPDGTRLATASNDVDVYIFALNENRPPQIGHGHSVFQRSVSFSPDGLRVLTCSRDGSTRVWDARTGRQVLQIGDGLTMQESAWTAPDGKRLLTSDMEGVITVHPLRPQRVSVGLKARGGS